MGKFEEAGVDLLSLQFSPQLEEMERFSPGAGRGQAEGVKMTRTLRLFACLGGLTAALFAQGRLLKVDDFSRFEDVGDPELSPDGQWVLYTVTSLDEASQKRQSDVWQVKWDGSQKLRLTSSP